MRAVDNFSHIQNTRQLPACIFMAPSYELPNLKLDEIANPICCYPQIRKSLGKGFAIEECDMVILRGQVSRLELYLLQYIIERFSITPKVLGIGSCSRARVEDLKKEGCFQGIDISFLLGCPPSIRSMQHFFESFLGQKLRVENVSV